ncbi:MAG TPA: hypothetical protein VGQ51_11165 [Puia sp.]|jgi:hypothetical protein|nr:hypothetical protein [Puia sp.]
MRNTLIIARILTWFNMIFWTGLLGLMLLSALALQLYPALAGVFLLCSIPLNNYAALQLHKAIRYPNVKLSHHTPTGIRFVGLVALFFGIYTVINAYVFLTDPKTPLQIIKQGMPEMKKLPDAQLIGVLHLLGVGSLVVGLAVIVNVVLNTRLLRWYYRIRSDKS